MRNTHEQGDVTSPVHVHAPRTSGMRGAKQIFMGLVMALAMTISNWALAAAPAVDNGTGASNVQATSAILNGTLTSTGGVLTQTRVYWGTTDGGTTVLNWTHAVNVGTGTVGPLSLAVTNLLPNQTYYYRFYATNLDGTVWASATASFLTPATAGPAPVNLGSTAHFTILAGAAITYPGAGTIVGDVGASPITGAAISIPPVQVTGTIYKVDAAGPAGANVVIDAGLLTTAKGDLTIAYNDAAGRVPVPADPVHLNPGLVAGSGNIGGLTLAPGLYKFTGAALLSGADVTLSGGADDVWIFQIATTLDVEAGVNRKVILAGGARAKNIFWQVGTSATLGTGSVFKGTILADQAITMDVGSTLEGRALAFSAGVTFGGGGGTVPSNNNAPVAAPDSYTTVKDTTLTVVTPVVLSNDSDANGNSLTAIKVTDPLHGTLTVFNADGSFTYVPTLGYSGPDSFTYKANNGTLDSSTVTVTLNVTQTFALTVVGGTGSGSFAAAALAPVVATIPVGKIFDTWTGADTVYLANALLASTIVTMPVANVTVTATFKDAPVGTNSLTVVNGTGGGAYVPGTVVAIAAVVPVGKVFAAWTGDIGYLADAMSASTNATTPIPGANIAVTATFTDAPVGTYTLTVVNGTGGGSYAAGAPIAVSAILNGMVFTTWAGDIAYLANAALASTTVTMPAANVTITAMFNTEPPWYPRIPWTPVVNNEVVPPADYEWYNLQVWDGVPGAVGAIMVLDTNVPRAEVTPEREYLLMGSDGLLPGIYYWRYRTWVAETDTYGTAWLPSVNGHAQTVDYVNPPVNLTNDPVAPTGLACTSPNPAVTGNFTLEFLAANAQGYDLEITGTLPQNNQVLHRAYFMPGADRVLPFNQVITRSVTLVGPDTCTWRVRGFNPVGDSAWSTSSVAITVTTGAALPKPATPDYNFMRPTAGWQVVTTADGNAYIAFEWKGVAGAAGYLVYVSSASGAPILNFVDVGNVTRLDSINGVRIALPPGTYLWSLIAYNGATPREYGGWNCSPLTPTQESPIFFEVIKDFTAPTMIMATKDVAVNTVDITWAGTAPATVDVLLFYTGAAGWLDAVSRPVTVTGDHTGTITLGARAWGAGTNYLLLTGKSATGKAGPRSRLFLIP